VDAYILGVFEPLSHFEGDCVAIIHRINDTDDKLIVVPQGKNYSDEQILALTEFQEQFFVSVILRQHNY
jgi:inorganic pyrophosphatase